MQLNSPSLSRGPGGAVRAGLATATWALLGILPRTAAGGQVDGSALVYSEPNRISAVETVVEATRESESGRTFALRLVLDALTGASANGAAPSTRVQTFTRPSGQGSYAVPAGATPLDPTFKDTRVAGSGTWGFPLGRLTRSTFGLNVSVERDYLSLGISGGITQDLAQRNTTLSAGISISHDAVSPAGGAPTAFTPMAAAISGGGDDDEGGGGGGPAQGKNVGDLLLGVTQVLDRATIARVNYTAGLATGYLTDPYKIVSEVQAPDATRPGEPARYLYESRPDRRLKQSVYGELRRRIGSDVAEASYRYYWDDWSVGSSTVEARLDHRLSGTTSLAPHYRYYNQRQADFYVPYLVSGRSLPNHASADYRLGTFHASTFGLEVAHILASGPTIRFGVEYYLQRGDSSPPGTFGALTTQDLFPDVSAWMVRVGASVPINW